MDSLCRLINRYDKFKTIAASLKWNEAVLSHYDFSVRYPIGFYAHICTFPEGYLTTHFEEAFVQMLLTVTAWYEEWDADFWDIPYDERMQCLTNGAALYSESITFPFLKLSECTAADIFSEIQSFQQFGAEFPEASHCLLQSFGDAPAVDLGSASVNPEHSWICVEEDTILLVHFGVWD